MGHPKMNLAANPTRDGLIGLVAQCNGDKHHILWVGNDGEVHIDPLTRKQTPAEFAEEKRSEIKFRLETFDRDDALLGPVGVENNEWIDRLLRVLVDFWRSDAKGYQYRF